MKDPFPLMHLCFPSAPPEVFFQLAVTLLTFWITYYVPGSMSSDLHALFYFILITTYAVGYFLYSSISLNQQLSNCFDLVTHR